MSFKIVLMPSFSRSVKYLKKRYRRVVEDVKVAVSEIEQNASIGTIIPDDFNVRKMRVASRDMQRGKSGGFRLLYILKIMDDVTIVYLLLLYSKVDQQDVTIDTLKELIEAIDNNIFEDG